MNRTDDLVLVTGALLIALATTATAQAAPSSVRYTEVRIHQLHEMIRLQGDVVAVHRAVVASEVAGLVTDLVVREGTEVAKGAPLAQLRRKTFELARAATSAQLEEARARLDQSERRLARARRLFEGEVIGESDVDDTHSDRAAWAARVASLEAELSRTEDWLEHSTIRAPFAGVIVERYTDLGEWVSQGGRVVELLSLDELEVKVEVPERYYGRIKDGSPARVWFSNLGLEVNTEIRSIVPLADPRARTFPVRMRIAATGRRLGVGMLAEVALASGEPRESLIVPKDAVISQGADRFVLVIDDESTIEKVPVETGAAVGDWLAVTGSIEAGARVVTRGNERLFPGTQVQGELLEYALP